jgi:IS5 family transposase
MQPKKQSNNDYDLFRSALEQIINIDHPLVKLSKSIDWDAFDNELGKLYAPSRGAPGLPTRLMVGIHYLKHTFNESDESVVARWLENPYWQYFCGFNFFQHDYPLHPTSLVKWRKRVGKSGVEMMLAETIRIAQKKKMLKKIDIEKVNIDTTVQEKNITFPTDAKLYFKMRDVLVNAAEKRGIKLRQNYR